MPEILIFSDIHVAPHKKSYKRLQDCLDALKWVFATAKQRKIKHIVFCGDLFDDRKKMDIPSYQRTFEIFQEEVTNGMEVYLLLGNHDLWHYEKCDISCVFPLAAIKGVTVVDRPCTLTIAGHEMAFLPYTHDPATDLEDIEYKSDFKILFGHVAIDGAILNTSGSIADVVVEHDGDMCKVDVGVFKGYNQVFLGHYHAEQRLSENVEYVGSPLQLSFGEAFQKKHVIAYDLKTHKKTYIENETSPKHYVIPDKEISNYKLESNFIRLLVDDNNSPETVELASQLASLNLGSLKIEQKPKKLEHDVKMMADAKSLLNTGINCLEGYVSCVDLGKLNKTRLLEIGKVISEYIHDDSAK